MICRWCDCAGPLSRTTGPPSVGSRSSSRLWPRSCRRTRPHEALSPLWTIFLLCNYRTTGLSSVGPRSSSPPWPSRRTSTHQIFIPPSTILLWSNYVLTSSFLDQAQFEPRCKPGRSVGKMCPQYVWNFWLGTEKFTSLVFLHFWQNILWQNGKIYDKNIFFLIKK